MRRTSPRSDVYVLPLTCAPAAWFPVSLRPFAEACREYAALEDADKRLARAKELHQEFIADGADQQVNLPSKVSSQVTADLKAAEDGAGEGGVAETLFEAAEAEVFKLMERDTYSRFKRDEESTTRLVESFYREAGVEANSPVTFEQFRLWCLGNPTVLVCFTGLTSSVKRVLDERKAKVAG